MERRSVNLPNVKKPCRECPMRKDSLEGWLGKERMTEILSAGSFVCHKKTDLQCAGHMLLKGRENDFVRLAEQLGLDTHIQGRELVFASDAECIAHHSISGA